MNHLRSHRIAAGYIKQESFAEKCHMSQGFLCDLENERKKPTRLTAEFIADILGVTAEALFPEGFSVRPTRYRTRVDDGVPRTEVPEVVRPRRHYPREFSVLCWKCRRRVTMANDGYRMAVDEDPRCPECGAVFYDIIPAEEALSL